MAYLMNTPSKTLATMEDVRAALNDGSINSYGGMEKWFIKSDWIISLIEELAQTQTFVYNAQVKKLAAERLGLPGITDYWCGTEGDELSLLVYNAQRYRHSDELRKQGFEPMTPDLVAQAYAKQKKIEIQSESVFGGDKKNQYAVKQIEGKLYAMLPRSRTKYIAPSG